MMTEQEAKTKWCPPGHALVDGCKCLASACMAWRWEVRDLVEVEHEISSMPNTIVERKHADQYKFKIVRELSDTGRCGLAGAP